MPWQPAELPSIQLGILQAVLERAGHSVQVRSLALPFLDACAAAAAGAGGFGLADYRLVSQDWGFLGAGDWVFAQPPFPAAAPREREYLDHLRRHGVPEAAIARLTAIRQAVPAFLDAWAAEILAARPAVVGFTTTFSQNVPSLALAARLRSSAPGLRVILGGANCDGPMGEALLRAFPAVDAVVRGEGERVLPALLEDLLAGAPIRPQPGLCFRQDGAVTVVPQARAGEVRMDEVPPPVFDEYFERLAASRLAAEVSPRVQLTYESARGCWWGMRSHCTFCGLNGTGMAFRSKSPERVRQELDGLATRHGRRAFQVVDNIMDRRYLRELLPRLRDDGRAWSLFYEIKPNMRRDEVRLLRDAGVDRVQPGIESLSTPILRLMRKGVSALQNIRFLKWCAQDGIRVVWAVLYGFPGEPEAEYARMAALAPSLFHLQPPLMSPLVLERFSPYHERSGDFGLEVTGPLDWYPLVYDLDPAALEGLAYAFAYRHRDGREPERYVAPLREAVEAWWAARDRAYRGLRYRRTGRGLVIDDRRAGRSRFTLGETEARLYLACEEGATAPEARRALAAAVGDPDVDEDDVRAFLDDTVASRLAYEENGRYLALALPARLREHA
jgi:ribosomal peptide maturation radical SAM protein 1